MERSVLVIVAFVALLIPTGSAAGNGRAPETGAADEETLWFDLVVDVALSTERLEYRNNFTRTAPVPGYVHVTVEDFSLVSALWQAIVYAWPPEQARKDCVWTLPPTEVLSRCNIGWFPVAAGAGDWRFAVEVNAEAGSFGSMRLHGVFVPFGGPAGPQDDCGTGDDAASWPGTPIEVPVWKCRGALAGQDRRDDYSFAAVAGERVRVALTADRGVTFDLCLWGPSSFATCQKAGPDTAAIDSGGQAAGTWRVSVQELIGPDRGYYILSVAVGSLRPCGLSRSGPLLVGTAGVEIEGISARTEDDLPRRCGGAPFALTSAAATDVFAVCWRDPNGQAIEPRGASVVALTTLPPVPGCRSPLVPTAGEIPLNAVAARVVYLLGAAGTYTLSST